MFTLHCIKGASIHNFQYVNLDSDSQYEPGLIRLHLSGTVLSEVAIGRNLWRLYDGIHHHVIRW